MAGHYKIFLGMAAGVGKTYRMLAEAQAAAEAGATAVIQPGGSVRDDEVIKAADQHGIAMVFTGTRHFRH